MNKYDKNRSFLEMTNQYATTLFNKLFDMGLRVGQFEYEVIKEEIRASVSTYAAHQSVEFAKWKDDNCRENASEDVVKALGNYYTYEQLYQYWHQNIYLKEKGV